MKQLFVIVIYCCIVSYSSSKRHEEKSESSIKFVGNNHTRSYLNITNQLQETERAKIVALTTAAKAYKISIHASEKFSTKRKGRKSKHRQSRRRKYKKNTKRKQSKSMNNNKNKRFKDHDSFSSMKNATTVSLQPILAPPDFMIRLQQTFQKDNNYMALKSVLQGDTIRSFLPLSDGLYGSSNIALPLCNLQNQSECALSDNHEYKQMNVYIFNLSSIPSTESVVGAEIRADKSAAPKYPSLSSSALYQRQNILVATYRNLNFSSKTENKIYKRIGSTVTVSQRSDVRWTSSNLFRLANVARHQSRIVVVKLLSEVIEEGSVASLILPQFFTMPNLRNISEVENRSFEGRNTQFMPIFTVYCNDTKLSSSNSQNKLTHEFWINLQDQTSNAKLKRSRRLARLKIARDPLAISSGRTNNELPDDTRRPTRLNSRPTTFSSLTGNGQTELSEQRRTDRNLIKSLKDRKSIKRRKMRKRRRSRKCRRQKHKRKSSRRCNQREKVSAGLSAPDRNLNRVTSICSRKSLRVNFSEIGWGDWIISPKFFDAFYCSGSCKFDTIKTASASNHAIIQSFINEFEINPEVPEPCCVPESLSSKSVLYFDQNESVVLKVYPHMSVDKCSCH